MTVEEFYDLFNDIDQTTGLPIAFDHFRVSQALPYLVYIVIGNNNVSADNSVYYTAPEIQLELYTENKSESTEATVENVLDSVPFFYTKDEGYLTDEQMYMVTYQFSL